MTQIVQLTGKHIAVVVPDETIDARISNDGTYLWPMISPNTMTNYIELPNGKYEFLFISSQVTEEDCKKVVEGNNGGIDDTMWRGYLLSEQTFACFTKPTALESFQSLLKSKNITTPVAILEITFCACRSLDILKTSAAKQVKISSEQMPKLPTSSPNFGKRCVGCQGGKI